MGSNDGNVVNIRDLPGTVTLDSSFNRGGDAVLLAHAAQDWLVHRSGSNVIFDDGDTQIIIPVGGSGLALLIDNDLRFLRFDGVSGDILIGDQVVDASPSPIQSPPLDGGWLGPDVLDASAVHRLFLSPSGDTTVSAQNVHITGSNGVDHVTFQTGTATFDASFNRGGDVITLLANAGEVTASISGSSAILKAVGPNAYFTLTIPVGTDGLTLDFADGDRTLLYDQAQDRFLIGDQVITADPSALFAFG